MNHHLLLRFTPPNRQRHTMMTTIFTDLAQIVMDFADALEFCSQTTQFSVSIIVTSSLHSISPGNSEDPYRFL